MLTIEPSHPLYNLSHPAVMKPISYVEYDRKSAGEGGIKELEESVNKEWQESRIANKENDSICPNTPYPLILIETGENLGFAGRNNVGIRYGLKHKFKYIWLLNNDTVFDSLCLNLCVDTFNELIGVVGPKILWYDDPSRIWYAGARIRMYKGGGLYIGLGRQDGSEFKGIKMAAFVSGCAFIARRTLFEEVGLLGEDFFLAHEDVDLSYRAGQQQMLFCVNLDSKIYHKAEEPWDGKALKPSVSTIKVVCFSSRRIVDFLGHNPTYQFRIIDASEKA